MALYTPYVEDKIASYVSYIMNESTSTNTYYDATFTVASSYRTFDIGSVRYTIPSSLITYDHDHDKYENRWVYKFQDLTTDYFRNSTGNRTNWYINPYYAPTGYDPTHPRIFYNGDTYEVWYGGNPVEKKRMEIKNNLTVIVKSRAHKLDKISDNEWVAMQTLREMISEADFRKYLKYGFIIVKGNSGKTYQVFRNKPHTKVYVKGQLVEEICVRIKDKVPATDNVIAFKAMIETDEEHFASLGNRYNMIQAA